MILVFPDVGLVYLLQQIVKPKLTYKLFRNNFFPDVNTTLVQLAEANYSGYAPIDVPASAWNFATVTAHIGGITALDIFWLNTSPSSVSLYGYFVVDATGAVLIAAARFDNAPVVVPVGQPLQLTPMLGDFSGFPC